MSDPDEGLIDLKRIPAPCLVQDATTVAAVSRAAGFPDEASARRAVEQAGVARVVAGLREENGRLRRRLKAAKGAAEAGELRARGT